MPSKTENSKITLGKSPHQLGARVRNFGLHRQGTMSRIPKRAY